MKISGERLWFMRCHRTGMIFGEQDEKNKIAGRQVPAVLRSLSTVAFFAGSLQVLQFFLIEAVAFINFSAHAMSQWKGIHVIFAGEG